MTSRRPARALLVAAGVLLPLGLLPVAPAGATHVPTAEGRLAPVITAPAGAGDLAVPGKRSHARPVDPRDVDRNAVLVRYAPRADAADRARLTRAVGGRVAGGVRGLGVVRLAVADSTAAADALNASPDVAWAEPEALVRRLADADTPERREVGYAAAEAADPRVTGTGVVVAVIDDGVDPANPDLAGRVTDGGDFTAGGRRPGGLTPAGSHGTGVAALLAAARDGQGIVGATPGATVRSYRVFSTGDDAAPTGALAEAILAVADDVARGQRIAVVNMSLGSGFASRAQAEALAEARRRAPQLVFVAASGNDAGRRPEFPAGFPGVLSVGASDQLEPDGPWTQWEGSTLGDVDVLAPGESVLTWDYVPGVAAPRLGPRTGTSFAAPLVSGIVAQLAAVGVTGDLARAAVKAGAEPPNDSPFPAVGDGAGRADALTAYRLGTGATSFSTAFVDEGSVVGRGGDRRDLELLRFVPTGGTAAAPAAVVSTGTVTPVGATATRPVTGGALVTARATWTTPAGDGGPGEATLSVRGPGDPAAQVLPLALVPASAGRAGLPAVSGRTYSFTYGRDYPYNAFSVSVGLRQGERAAITVDYPADVRAPAPVYVWQPGVTGSPYPVGSNHAMPDEGDEEPGVDGTLDLVAPRPGRYVIGFVLDDPDQIGTYRLTVRAAGPVARQAVPVVTATASTGGPFPVRWAGGSRSARYDVQYAVRTRGSDGVWRDGPWRTWLAGTPALSGTFGASGVPAAVTPGQTVLVRTRVLDLGDVGAWSTPALATVPLDDARGPAYSAGWTRSAPPGAFLGSVTQARGAGRTMTLRAEGRRFALVGVRCASCGSFHVHVDGVRVTRTPVGTTGRATARQVLWTSGWTSTARARTIKVVTTSGASAPWVVLDAVAVTR